MEKGLYDLIIKGYVPKDADVTPALNKEGNPFNITSKNINFKYKKTKFKDEVANATYNNFKFTPQYNINLFYNTFQPIFKKIDINKNIKNININIHKEKKESSSKIKNFEEDNDTFFITGRNTYNNNINKNNSLSANLNETDKNETRKDNYINNNINIYKNIDNKLYPIYLNKTYTVSKTKKNFYDYIKQLDSNESNNYILKFEYYRLIIDEQFNKFRNENIDIWNKLENILSNLTILLNKLHFNYAEIDSSKIIKLIEYYDQDIKYITNKDLLMCLTDNDLKNKGFELDNEKFLYLKIKGIFIMRIQRAVRKMLSIKKYKIMKIYEIITIIIQKYYRSYSKRKNIRSKMPTFRNEIHNKYIEIFKDFKNNWDNKKNTKRIEIHINSLSYDSYNNCKIDKYILKESLQLNRLIRLADPNLEIIYILPFNLSEEILSYYYSTLKNVSLDNIEKRVKFIIPEACEYLPNNYSLSKLLYLSPKTLNQIKILTKNKYSYIVPGMISHIEEYLSYILELPILMGNIKKIDSLFNKSGIKSTLEINDVPFPISAWDIKTSEEFYSSLAHLIATYPAINIWIFKANDNINGKSIAYFDTSRVEFIVELKKEKKFDKKFTVELFQEKLYYQLKNIVIKNVVYCYSNFYHDWNEYLQNFLKHKGIIESCPTKGLDGIMGSPCIPFLIEPSGKINILPSFEKININYFKNIICTSPQNNLEKNTLIKLAKHLGTFLYHQEIVGYVTIECVTFHDGRNILYWCTDMKYGLTQIICDIQYGYFLYSQGIIALKKMKENNILNDNIWDDNIESNNKYEPTITTDLFNNNKTLSDAKKDQMSPNVMVFSIPFISTDIIKNIKLKHFLRDFRYDNIVYDIQKKEGIIFNLCDGLECGIFGICGIINNDNNERINMNYKLWKLIDQSMNVLKNIVYKTNKKTLMSTINKQVFGSPERTDAVELHLIFARIKKIVKEKEKESEKEEKRRKKIANEPYL